MKTETQITLTECVLDIMNLFVSEMMELKRRHPNWTTDPVHATALLNERTGALTETTLQFHHYGSDELQELMMKEAAQCGAMVLRFLLNISQYKSMRDLPMTSATTELVCADLEQIKEYLAFADDEPINNGFRPEFNRELSNAVRELEAFRRGEKIL